MLTMVRCLSLFLPFPGSQFSRVFQIATVVAVLSAGAALAAQDNSPSASTLVWHALGKEARLEGKGWKETKHPYDRLPARAEGVVRGAVWQLSQHSAGFHYRFVTDATSLSVRWTLRSNRLAMPHMPATGVSGLDLYVRDGGTWQWLGAGRPKSDVKNEASLVKGLQPGKREYLLYLPLYNGVELVEIGLPSGALFEPAPDRDIKKKPIVFYGTSITQGGCASRPGMAYPAILGRRLDWPTINLGFSGNGKTEPEVAGLLAELDPVAYVIDSLPNLSVAEVSERMEPFVAALRASHPQAPIVLVENLMYPDGILVDSRRDKVVEANAVLRALYDRLKAAGDERLYYIPSSVSLGADGDDTVDGTHPTDAGFIRMADGMEPFLREVLKEAGQSDEADAGFEPLFDGKTLSGWKPHDGMPPLHRAGKWWVEDGMLYGTQEPAGKGGLLWLDRQFTDFILKLQVKLTYPMDTGVFLRVGPTGLSHQVTLDYRPGSDVGAIFIPFLGHTYVYRNREGHRLIKPDDWNDVTIRMEGNPARIRVWLNDRLLTDFRHSEQTTKGLPTSGGIAFQIHPDITQWPVWKKGESVKFRNVRIKELP